MYKYATFFGGAFNDTETTEYKESVLIGELLSSKGYIIKNGGYRGLMEAVSKGAAINNGTSIGYTCRDFPSTKGNKYLTNTIIADNIYERLELLISESDIFIIQKGGIGTLSELFLTLDIYRKKDIKPDIYLIGDFWNDIFNSLKVIIPEKEFDLFKILKDFEELKNKLT